MSSFPLRLLPMMGAYELVLVRWLLSCHFDADALVGTTAPEEISLQPVGK